MITKTLRYFQYLTLTTAVTVKATAFDSKVNGKFWRVRVIDGSKPGMVFDKLHCPQSEAEAVAVADAAIRGFVTTIHSQLMEELA